MHPLSLLLFSADSQHAIDVRPSDPKLVELLCFLELPLMDLEYAAHLLNLGFKLENMFPFIIIGGIKHLVLRYRLEAEVFGVGLPEGCLTFKTFLDELKL
jgi:hypothetical protein